MKIQYLMTTVLLLSVGACSMQPEPTSQGRGAQSVVAAVAPTSTGSSIGRTALSSGAQAAAPTRTGAGPARISLKRPPTVPTPRPTPPATFDTAAQAATASMGTLANLVGIDHPTNRGFASAAEVTSSTLADGLPVQFVGLSSLRAFTPGQDTKTLPFDKQEVMYPITVGGAVRSSVTVQKGPDGKWQTVMFGHASVAQSSQSVRLHITSTRSVDTGTLSLIEIPTVHAYLLSHTENGVHMVTPLRDIPGTSYTTGVTQPAAQVFAALQPLAAKVNPNVPN